MRSYFTDYLWIFSYRVLVLAISFVSSIILARYFGPELYGKYQYVLSISILFSILINFGYDKVIVKEINLNRFELSSLITNVIFLKLIGSIILLILGFFFLKLFYKHNLEYLFLLIIFSYVLSSFSLKLIFESRNENSYIFISSIVSTLLSLILKIYLVIIKAEINIFGLSFILEIILSNIILLFFFFRTRNFFQIKINFKIIKEIFRQSFPFAFSTFSGSLYFYIDRIMIGGFEQFFELGIYTIYILFFSYSRIITTSLIIVLAPKLVRIFKSDKNKYFLLTQNFLGLSFIISIVVSIFYLIFLENIIRIIFGENFQGYGILIYFLAFNLIINAGSIFFADYLLLINKSTLMMYTRFISLLINIVLNYFLIPKYGIYGAALSTSLTVLTYSVILNFFNNNLRNYLFLYFRAFKEVFVNPKGVIYSSYAFLIKKIF